MIGGFFWGYYIVNYFFKDPQKNHQIWKWNIQSDRAFATMGKKKMLTLMKDNKDFGDTHNDKT